MMLCHQKINVTPIFYGKYNFDLAFFMGFGSDLRIFLMTGHVYETNVLSKIDKTIKQPNGRPRLNAFTWKRPTPLSKGWPSREIGMLASITALGHNTQALEFNTKPVIGVTAGQNLTKSLSAVVQTDRRHKFGLFDNVYFIGTSWLSR